MSEGEEVKRRRRRSSQEIRRLVAEFRTSGLRASEFCRIHGLTHGTLQRGPRRERIALGSQGGVYLGGKRTPLVYDAFDLLNLGGTDFSFRPLTERRKLLAKFLDKVPDDICFSEELREQEKLVRAEVLLPR